MKKRKKVHEIIEEYEDRGFPVPVHENELEEEEYGEYDDGDE